MLRPFLSLYPALIVSVPTAFAQPVIHAAMHLPVAGTSRPICYSAMMLEEPPGGVAAIWDLTWLDAEPADTIWYIDPSMTQQGTAFGSAVAVVDSFDVEFASVRYLAMGTDGLNDAGYEMFYCPMATLRLLLPTVVEFGDSFSDEHGAYCTYESSDPPLWLEFAESGTHDLIADGWGTLLMPWGTVENVLRTSSVWQYLRNDPPPAQDMEFRQEITDYWHDGAVEPVVRIVKRFQRLAGASQWNETGHHVEHIIDIGLGLDARVVPTVDLSPNPTQNVVRIRTNGPLQPGTRIQVYDAVGRMRWAPTSGERSEEDHTLEIDLSALEAGHYTVRIPGDAGRSITARVVKL